jgi:hypothetical protein
MRHRFVASESRAGAPGTAKKGRTESRVPVHCRAISDVISIFCAIREGAPEEKLTQRLILHGI